MLPDVTTHKPVEVKDTLAVLGKASTNPWSRYLDHGNSTADIWTEVCIEQLVFY